MSALTEAEAHCAQMVEQSDPERFRALMATPEADRRKLWPLYAVNLELARAPWASKEPMIAEMRVQWWVDALEALRAEGTAPPSEIGPALAGLRPVAGLLLELAETRRQDCWPDGFEDHEAVWRYLDGTAGALYLAAAQLLGVDAREWSVLRGQAQGVGLAAYLCAVPEIERRGRHPLPDGRSAAIAGLAQAGLARLAHGNLSRQARRALLPGWESRAILTEISRNPACVSQDIPRKNGLKRQFSFLRHALAA
ncbi:squalene/phytoene synthase family protein [Thioclava sp. GXIMD4216]|uniref:squalene/phytoene synthase family protein n=1 Tax=Thioclava sp. GXIMD4216 TaxID=3131929 RepID=UPI0030CC413C